MQLDMTISFPQRPLPREFFIPGLRQTVLIGLISPVNGFAVVQPTRDPTEQVWIPPQGAIGHNQSIFQAGHSVLREEIPSVRRDHPHAPPRIDWKDGVYVGSALNLEARSGYAKHVHVLLLRVHADTVVRLQPDQQECRAAQWVYSNNMLEALLLPTWKTNPRKAEIVTTAVWMAKKIGWLS